MIQVDFSHLRIAVSLVSAFTFSSVAAQDSTYVPHIIAGGDCVCPFELDFTVITIPTFTNLRITIEEAKTASLNDFYALVDNRPGSEPINVSFFQGRVPVIGEYWTIGPLSAGDKVDFRIFSRILFERTTCDPNRWGQISQVGIGHWNIIFEDWCDKDWDDLVVDVSSIPGNPTVTILTPAHGTSFVTDNASTFRVHAEGWATDMYGGDISDLIDWFVLPNSISGTCQPNTRQDSRVFDFTARNIPSRPLRGLGRLQYDIFAMSAPNLIPIIDLNVMVQDDIDTVRQQYIDYTIKLAYKYRFLLTGGPVIIPTEPILDEVLLLACPCYRSWAGDLNARCVLTSTFRSPVRNRDPDVDGKWNSLHQYGLAIDIGYNDKGAPGQKDDSRAVWDCVSSLGYPQIYPYEHPELAYNHVHVQNYHYVDMPYVER